MCPETCLPEDGALVGMCGGVFGPDQFQANPTDTYLALNLGLGRESAWQLNATIWALSSVPRWIFHP